MIGRISGGGVEHVFIINIFGSIGSKGSMASVVSTTESLFKGVIGRGPSTRMGFIPRVVPEDPSGIRVLSR